MPTTYQPCDNDDCADRVIAHPFPVRKTPVTFTQAHETRVPGTDDEVRVEAGATGVVESFVPEWHHVHVRLDDGVEVWADPDVLEWDVEVVIGWTISDPETGYSSFMDGYRPGAKQQRVMVHVDKPQYGSLAEAVETIAEAAFTATNHPDPEHLTGYARQIHDGIYASGYRGQGAHYSLSAGDTVTISEVTLACANTGWQRVAYADATR